MVEVRESKEGCSINNQDSLDALLPPEGLPELHRMAFFPVKVGDKVIIVGPGPGQEVIETVGEEVRKRNENLSVVYALGLPDREVFYSRYDYKDNDPGEACSPF